LPDLYEEEQSYVKVPIDVKVIHLFYRD
jgi:hypothetical protein